MSDRMKPIPFDKLMNWIVEEYRTQGTIFGVEKIFHNIPQDKKLPIFGTLIEAPFGSAAGPHTQLAQNIVAGYAAGGRFFELKTVQVLDGENLQINKPCILASDEVYYVESSTGLKVEEVLDEYIKAWFAIKLISREFDLGCDDGFVFNMNLGYDFLSISSNKIDTFIESLKDSSQTNTFKTCMKWALMNISLFNCIDRDFIYSISPKICNSVTFSTMNVCKADEIGKIADYLMFKKHLHTFIKLSPTLLGYKFVRKTLNSMGYNDVQLNESYFDESLKYKDVTPIIRRLKKRSGKECLSFGVKLTSALQVENKTGELAGIQTNMSGRALYPLTIAMAAKFSKTFNGEVRISYSGGADAVNIEKLFAAGIWPITMATTLLKPGGYERLYQMAQIMLDCGDEPFSGVNTAAVASYMEDEDGDPYYIKSPHTVTKCKKDGKIPLIDCCTDDCAMIQDMSIESEKTELSGVYAFCAQVCPNRANIVLEITGKAKRQILHMDGMCNECGNCKTFCSYGSKPHQDKLTLFWSEKAFLNSNNDGFFAVSMEKKVFCIRLNGCVKTYSLLEPNTLNEDISEMIITAAEKYQYLFI